MIKMIACVGKKFEIGLNGDMPWGMDMKGDLKFFKEKTTNHPIIMGKKTYQSLGRPLPNRKNIVLTRNIEKTKEEISNENVFVYSNVGDILKMLKNKGYEDVFIIGGAEIYSLCLPYADEVYLTEINKTFLADTFFPSLDEKEWVKEKIKDGIVDEKTKYEHSFYLYKRK